jgi:alkylation response protein AidB-like acyl-CoA dehydrogenase
MNFGFTEEQDLLRAQVVRFMRDACPMAKVREITQTATCFDLQLWRQMAELGWLGLIIPQQHSGIGLKWIDLTVVLEETARGLCPLPIASQALSAAAILRCGNDDHKANWLPRLASGESICTLGLYDEPNWIHRDAVTLQATKTADGISVTGTKSFVPDALAAQHYLLAVQVGDELALAAVSRERVKVSAQPGMDTTKPMGNVQLDAVHIGQDYVLPLTTTDLTHLNDLGAVAVTAEMVGAAEAALRMTAD